MQEACQAYLAQQGYAQYEVSAYARQGRRCEHNLGYWRFGDYLGIGAGAHGKLTCDDGSGIVRTVRARHPSAYLAASTAAGRVTERRMVVAAELPFEYCLNSLRLLEGFTLGEFESRTGLPRAALQPGLDAACRRGLVQSDGDRWSASLLGRRFLNELQAGFLPL